MANVNKIDSNITGLRIAEEATIGVLPGTPEWVPMEPNSYNDFGGEIETIARNPINPSRQRKKGVVTGLSANAGFVSDLTQTNLQNIMQGFFFADIRAKGLDQAITGVSTGANDLFLVADTTGYTVGDIVKTSGCTNTANNGTFEITAIVANTSIEVAETLVAEGSPPAGAKLIVIATTNTAGDIDVDASGTYPALTSTTLDFTLLGLVPGAWIFIGGDAAGSSFTTAANNGFKRVLSIAANRLELDKSVLTMVTEASTTETIEIYLPHILKNETGTAIKRRTYQLERTLGALDEAQPAQIQSEYVVGGVPSQLTLNLGTADKITVDLEFLGTDVEQRDGATGVKAGNRPALVEADAFNTSSDFSRIKMSKITAGDEAPVPLFGFVTELSMSINNNISPNNAIATLGAFDMSAGTFEVGGEVTAYFSDITAVQSIRNNDSVTLDMIIVKNNAGVVFDIPLTSLGNGRLSISQDEAVTLPISMGAATAASYNSGMDYTLMFCFFNGLPDLAETI